MTPREPRSMKAQNYAMVSGDFHHVDLLAAYAPVIDILVGKAIVRRITEIAQGFVFYLTPSVGGEVRPRSMKLCLPR